MPCNDCEEELITTSQGPQGEQGEQGNPGIDGANGIVDWSLFDLSCWVAQGISEEEATNDEISQDLIDTVCELYEAINVTPIAINDARTINQDTTVYIEVINNDRYYPDVTVTIDIAPSNGIATIEPDNKTIKYIPTTGFIGVDDFDYQINDGTNTSTATVTITVQEVITQQTIQNTVLEQLQILLASDEYWDLGFNIGDKIGISDINLIDFDFTNPLTAGIGKAGRYSKWAICNGNNGADDLTDGTFRGFNHTNTDYDESAKAGGSDSVSLVAANIPAHRHKSTQYTLDWNTYATDWATKHTLETGGNTEVNKYQLSSGGITDSGNDQDYYVSTSNTGDGTDNIGNQNEIANGTGTVTPVDIRNAFKTVILIQKIY